jgi:hypothetical protein
MMAMTMPKDLPTVPALRQAIALGLEREVPRPVLDLAPGAIAGRMLHRPAVGDGDTYDAEGDEEQQDGRDKVVH